MKRWVIPFLLLFVLTSCRMPSLLPQTPVGAAGQVVAPHAGMVLKGHVEAPRRVAAIDQWRFDEIINRATIALVDSETGHTLGTSLVEKDGTFKMGFGEGFVPVDGRAYYLDLLKGIRLEPGNSQSPYNQAGGDVLRMRNILFYQAVDNGWKSLYTATASNQVVVTNRTTTMSIAIALKRQAGDALNLSDFIGALEKDPIDTVGGLNNETFEALKEIVEEAINNDRDPVQYAVYDESQGTFLNPWVGFSISHVSPTSGGIGTEILVQGDGFDLDTPVVAVNGVTAQILSVTADTIRAKIAPGSRTGPVSVKIGTTTQAGPTFRVMFHDGHSALLGDKLYVANPDWETVVEVSPNGDVKKLWDRATLSDLRNPTQIAVWNDRLYVSCKGNGKILRLNPANPTDWSVFNPTAIVSSAYGLAFDIDGNLYVSSNRAAPNGEVVKLDPTGKRDGEYKGFDLPRGIAFDYLGNLFVAEQGGRIAKLTAPTMAAETWGIVPSPMGLAVDSAGDLFVTSNTNHAVYRITRFRAMSVFAMLNSPGGITRDERGTFYVSDTTKNLVNRISPTGDAKVYAYGISNPRGLAVDPQFGTIYVALSQSNAILKVEEGVLRPFVTGIANPMTINFRGDGLLIAHPETHTISYARRGGQLSTLATGLEYPGGADQEDNGGGNLTGPLYIPRFGDQDNGSARRLPRYDIRALNTGTYHGMDVIHNGAKTLRRWLYRHNSPSTTATLVAIDGSGNFYILDTSDRTLTRVGAAPGGGNSSRAMQRLAGERSPYQFPSEPAWVAVDADENVYVSVPAANKIYRFVKAASYAMDEISGFSSPWGIAFSDTTPQAMFVSNMGDGNIRRVSNPVTATTVDAAFSFMATRTVKGLAYMASATKGTGTLYMADGTTVRKADLIANNYENGTYEEYKTGLPVAWSYLYARSSTKELFGYGNRTFAHKISAPPAKTITEHLNLTGDSILDGFAFDANFNTIRWTRRFGIVSLATFTTTREVELHGDYLYVASPDNYTGSANTIAGGVLRIDLVTGNELFLPLRSYSLGVEDGSGDLYIGATDSKIHRMDAAGRNTAIWDLKTLPYGLDVRGSTVWAVGSNGLIYEQVIADPTIRGHKYGMEKPGF